jgi:ketosteroid isomerase-like protein
VSRPEEIAARFNDRINARDPEGLAELMTDDHTFVDSEGSSIAGKAACVEAWRGFFEQFPDYRNVFDSLEATGGVVVITGHSECSVPALAGPALWQATVDGDRVARWQVYDDTAANRMRLHL